MLRISKIRCTIISFNQVTYPGWQLKAGDRSLEIGCHSDLAYWDQGKEYRVQGRQPAEKYRDSHSLKRLTKRCITNYVQRLPRGVAVMVKVRLSVMRKRSPKQKWSMEQLVEPKQVRATTLPQPWVADSREPCKALPFLVTGAA